MSSSISSTSSTTAYYRFPSNTQIIKPRNSSTFSVPILKFPNLLLHKKFVLKRHRFKCNSSTTPSDPPPGENESKQVLDAFFLGKAFAEALNERIESTVGEFLSTVGRLQAEQQKQVQEFQDEVLERAKKAKEKAAREAMEAQGLVPQTVASNISSPTANKSENTSVIVSIVIDDEPTISPSSSTSGSNDQSPNNGSSDPFLEISIDD